MARSHPAARQARGEKHFRAALPGQSAQGLGEVFVERREGAGVAKFLETGDQMVASPNASGRSSPRQAESASIRARGGRS